MVHLFLELARQRNPEGEVENADAIVQGTRVDTLYQVQGTIENSTTYVIEFDGKSAGRLRVVRTAGEIFIGGIQLLPDCQGRGIGTAVITTLIQEGLSRGVPVALEVEKDNPDAERLYRRLGFERYGETNDAFRMSIRAAAP
jgi:ribosomal protein S18 acetylase RimI-like enzyme